MAAITPRGAARVVVWTVAAIYLCCMLAASLAALVLGSVLIGQGIPKVDPHAPWVVRTLVTGEKAPKSLGHLVITAHPWLGALLLLAGTWIILLLATLLLDRKMRRAVTARNAQRIAFLFTEGAVLAGGVWLLTVVANDGLSGWLYWLIFLVTLLGLWLLGEAADTFTEELLGGEWNDY